MTRPLRRAPRRTKAGYLDLARTLAEQPARLGATPHAHAVAHVDVSRVAAIAGVTRTALYRLWDTQDAFRADLVAYLAAADDAPWADLDPGRLGDAGAGPGGAAGIRERVRDRLDADQRALAADVRPLLRAGIAGYPGTGVVGPARTGDDAPAPVHPPAAACAAGVLAERERQRLARSAGLVERALVAAGRRGTAGITALDIAVVAAALADGLALAARTTPPELLVTADGTPAPRRGLLAVGTLALFDRLTEPEPGGPGTVARTDVAAAPPRPGGPPAAALPTGRRLEYLRVAAGLAAAEPPPSEPADCAGLGYVSLDALARAAGVTRATVRKLWRTQGAFRVDLFVHLLVRHRAEVVARLAPATPAGGDPLRRAGVGVAALVGADPRRASHLSGAPQLVVPAFRDHARHHATALLDGPTAALGALLAAAGREPRPRVADQRQAVLVLGLIDGLTRVARTLPDLVRPGLVALAVERLVVGLSRPLRPGPTPLQPTT